QPRAGEPIDLRTLARDPARSAGHVEFAAQAHRRMTGVDPARDAAFDISGLVAEGGERLRGGLARLPSVLAVKRDRPRARQAFRPLRDLVRMTAPRAGQYTGLRAIRFVLTYIDDRRRHRQTELRIQRVSGNRRRHVHLLLRAEAAASYAQVSSARPSAPPRTDSAGASRARWPRRSNQSKRASSAPVRSPMPASAAGTTSAAQVAAGSCRIVMPCGMPAGAASGIAASTRPSSSEGGSIKMQKGSPAEASPAAAVDRCAFAASL